MQARLNEDLSLETLSSRLGVSPTHFQKTFKARIGETPKAHVERLRLERAAFRLLVQDETLINIALDHGYNSPETFTRAFRRRFGKAPSEYRAWARRGRSDPSSRPRHGCANYSLSGVRIRRLAPAHLAFIRHVGPYEQVSDKLYAQLARWADVRCVPGPRIWMGLGHDAPGTTASDKLRFDAALVIPSAFTGDCEIAYQSFPGGEFAIITHVGAFSTLPCAYRSIFSQATSLPGHRLGGLPVVEIYQTAKVTSQRALNVTDICLPVERRS
jgi:AraC family transcriptional regulator